jgi:hypothetical protein
MGRDVSSAEQDRYLGLYVHDDVRVSRRLTANVGLRYEYESPITERFNRSVAHFAFDQPSPIEAQARANYAANPIPEIAPERFRVVGGLTFAGVGGNPRGIWQAEKANFMPRVGLASQLRPATVLRAGYGVFYATTTNNTNIIQSGFSQQTPIQATLDSGLTFVATTANPLPNGLIAPMGAAGGLSTNLGQGVSFYPVRRKHPYAQRWSASAQQRLPLGFVAEVAYVGNRGTRLPVTRDLNPTPAQYLSRLPYRDNQIIAYMAQVFPSPFAKLGPIFLANKSRAALLAPYPQFGSVTVAEPVGYSWYHSLQARAERRFSRGFTYQFGFAWSKTMEATAFQNSTDAVPYRSISSFDRTFRLAMSGIWELPIGRGRRFGGQLPAVIEAVVGRWQLNGVVQRQSGPPLGFGDVWTLFTGDSTKVALPKDQRSVDRWFNTGAGFNRNSAQQLSQNIRVSALRFSDIRGDGQARYDFSAIKAFDLTERLKLQFRAECINAWNHPNLATPNTTVTSTAFGTITLQDPPRTFQFSLRLVL